MAVALGDTMTEVATVKQDEHIIHKMGGSSQLSQQLGSRFLPLIIIFLIAGVLSGFVLSKVIGGASPLSSTEEVSQVNPNKIKKGQVYGAQDAKTFPDSTEGKLEKGGLGGEGSHKLIRPGGDSQTVYLTSSTLELDTFVDRKIKVWGATYKPQKVGWFMDVGRVEVLE